MTNVLGRIYHNGKDYFDYKGGIVSSALGGLAIGLINCREGIEYALSSGGKEAGKVLVLASFNLKTAEKLSTGIKNKPLAITLSGIIPAAIATGVTYAIHKFTPGTPYPFYSTLPTLVAAPFAFGCWGLFKRNGLEKKLALESRGE